MKKILFLMLSACVVTNVYADNAVVKCTGGLQSIELRLSKTSDITKDSSALLLNNKNAAISSITVQSTDYGILGINVQVGKGPGKTSYRFENLGSNKCFSVYESKQKGLARVKVYNSIGMINNANCSCDQD